MDLAWIEDFIAVADLRSFSKAAVERHVTQSALSRRVMALEDWYGARLVDRSSHPVALTDLGQRFVGLCEQVMADLYRSRREARAEASATGPTVRFAMPHSLASNFFPAWWRSERGDSKMTAKVTAGDLPACIELLLSGACQYILYYSNVDVPSGLEAVDLVRRKVGADDLVPVSATDDRSKPLFELTSRTEAVRTPLLAYSGESFMGRVTARIHAQMENRWPLIPRYESSLVEALKAEALVGEGIAWLPRSCVRAELEAKKLRIVGHRSLVIPLEILLCRPKLATIPASARHVLASFLPSGD